MGDLSALQYCILRINAKEKWGILLAKDCKVLEQIKLKNITYILIILFFFSLKKCGQTIYRCKHLPSDFKRNEILTLVS